MRDESSEAWPFFRQDPDKVVLGPSHGASPSPRPPVRIFLGTEEAQYRAERIFFYSVLRVRDPTRTYEIYLMKNLVGFNRRHWRTGFTNYRYAIPDFAGRMGRAIYNDVDQIYLADPALLFDLEMGNHGYLAISSSDTSVMLIDCAKMWPLWNRQAASTGNKYSLLNKPRKTPGLWGSLDPQWNARDAEYVEGGTLCLHYTALHQQPWEPFPEHYSYHENPLGYLWHELEREADAADYQVFTRQQPSPDFDRRLGSNLPRREARTAGLPSRAAVRLFQSLAVDDTIDLAAAGTPSETVPGLGRANAVAHLRLRAASDAWPEAPAATVLVHDLLEHVPPADLGWLLDQVFRLARSAVYFAVKAAAQRGLGSPAWWRRRIDEAARGHERTSWQLDVIDPRSAMHSFTVQRVARPAGQKPKVWAIATGGPDDASVRALAAGIAPAYDIEERTPSDDFTPPWPALLIAGGPEGARLGRQIASRSAGRTRTVQIGVPQAPFAAFDLLIATPAEDLPSRSNVLQVAAPLAGAQSADDLIRARAADIDPLSRALFNLRGGGGKTYRGTPHQQHLPGRIIDSLIVRGLITPPPSAGAQKRALEARGLANGSGPPISSPRPLNDLERAVARIARLMSEQGVAAD